MIKALSAFRRAIRAHKQLIKLDPWRFDPVEIRKRQQDEPEMIEMLRALSKAYGTPFQDELVWWRRQKYGVVVDCPKTRLIEKTLTELKMWMAVGGEAMDFYQKHQRYRDDSPSMVADALDVAYALGRLAAGMDLDGQDKRDPLFTNMPSMSEALKRAYGTPPASEQKP